MSLLNPIITWFIKKRIHQIELFMKYPHDVQSEILMSLIKKAKNTEWGRKYDYASITSFEEYKNRVPITTYEALFPKIERVMKGENNILWPSKIKWFAKSSGTTNARSKFIPVSPESLKETHFKVGKDMLSLYINNFNPETELFSGKTVSIGGSHQINHLNPNSYYGDVSAVITQNLPFWAQIIRSPTLKTALIDKWEDKLEQMVEECSTQRITGLAGVPTWTIILINEIVKRNKADNILDVWPDLELFAHGAVSFEPYRELFKELIPTDKMNYLEVYNASEGFFGIKDQPGRDDMLLMLDYGVFYEFLPMDQFGTETPQTVLLEGVEIGKNYAMIISSNAGLWRYMIGDTVRFTCTDPYRIRISGRTKHFINAFGEEVIVENADAAIAHACHVTGAVIENYTAAPVYFEKDGQGRHEWLVEFEKAPKELNLFTEALDRKLREINSDYDAKRQKNIALQIPLMHALPQGTFYRWLEGQGKVGGQYKVPRLSNNRDYIDDILGMVR